MINKNIILGSLNPFLNKENVVIENQGVNDIITGILHTINTKANTTKFINILLDMICKKLQKIYGIF